MKMELNDLYKSILRYAGMDTDAEGYISAIIGDQREPAILGGVRMVIPTEYHLRHANPKEKIVFHPLSENVLRGESEVIMKLREVLNIRLNFTFGIIASSLLNLVASPEEHKKLTPDQTELLIAVKDVDNTTVNNFISLMVEGIKTDPNKMFMNIYLKRGGSIGTKRYSRVGIYSFNLYEELQKDSNEIYGVKLRVKDKEAFKQLYQYILPALVDDMTAYNRGSESSLAPYLDALMKTSCAVASRFNDIFYQFGDFIDQSEKLVFDSDWVETFENLDVMHSEIRRIPVQAGNEGTMQQATQDARPALPLPSTPTAPQIQATQYTPGFAPPATMQQTQQPPTVKHTSRGLDWRSLAAANPSLMMSGNAMAPILQQQQQAVFQQQQNRPAAWDTPPQHQFPMRPQGFQQPFGAQMSPFQGNQGFQQPFGNPMMGGVNNGI